MNDEQAGPTRQRPLSIWELPSSLLTQPHNFRKRTAKRGRERRHQAAIVAFIYRSRFATASQVQRRFTDFLKSDRTTRRHLAEMHESLGYLDLVPTPSPLWPKVYSVSRRGMRKLARAFQKKQPTWKPPVNDRKRVGFSIHHVYHELACTEFLLQIHESAKAVGAELLETQRRSLVKNDAFCLPEGSRNRLVPDGMFLLRTTRGMICSFLELDTGTMSLNAVDEKVRRYSTWAATERGRAFVTEAYRKHGATNPQAKLRLTIICGGNDQSEGQRRLYALQQIAGKLPTTIRSTVWIATTTTIRDATNILTGDVWYRLEQNGQSTKKLRPFFVSAPI